MMEWIRSWLIGVTVAALVAAMADSLASDGTVKKISKLAGGLLMVVAVIQPVVGLNYADIAGILTEYRLETGEYDLDLETENMRLMKIIIEEQTGAYIQDKATEFGVDCKVKVTCQADEGGNLYPASVIIRGELTQEQIDALCRIVEGDLAIAPQNQTYERTTG